MVSNARHHNRVLFFGRVIAQLGLVFWISACVGTLAPATAAGLSLLYSAMNGVTLSVILLAFTGASIGSHGRHAAALSDGSRSKDRRRSLTPQAARWRYLDFINLFLMLLRLFGDRR